MFLSRKRLSSVGGLVAGNHSFFKAYILVNDEIIRIPLHPLMDDSNLDPDIA